MSNENTFDQLKQAYLEGVEYYRTNTPLWYLRDRTNPYDTRSRKDATLEEMELAEAWEAGWSSARHEDQYTNPNFKAKQSADESTA